MVTIVVSGAWGASGRGEDVCLAARRALSSSWALIFSGKEGSKTEWGPEQFRHLGGEDGQQETVGRMWPSFGQPRFSQRCWDLVCVPAQMGQVGDLSVQVWCGWPRRKQLRQWAVGLAERMGATLRGRENRRMVVPICWACSLETEITIDVAFFRALEAGLGWR